MTPSRDLVVIGAAEGRLAALSTILNALPATFQAPVLVALRTHPQSVQTLVRIMNGYSCMPVSYACEGRFPRVGHAYLPPAGVDLVIRPGGAIGLDDRDTTPRGMRPIDRLFSSAATTHGRRLIGVLLSGCDGEGTLGLSAIEESHGVVVLEDPERAAVPSLLLRAPDPDRLHHVARLDGIATLLATLVDG
ncbi:chemotaxis protein CheB [Variovorax sp. M-6]|uniref:chemotaxis protein CheB n=1 Tax=Variovorax sp. M-6 TaxID=3233041 RepID=UPI003F9B3721